MQRQANVFLTSSDDILEFKIFSSTFSFFSFFLLSLLLVFLLLLSPLFSILFTYLSLLLRGLSILIMPIAQPNYFLFYHNVSNVICHI